MTLKTNSLQASGVSPTILTAALGFVARNPWIANHFWTAHHHARTVMRWWKIARSSGDATPYDPSTRMLILGLTNRCNANCCFCAYPKLRSRKGIMPLDTAETALREWSSMGGTKLGLALSVGEPTLHPDFFAICALARSLGITSISTTTNGTTLLGKAVSFINCGLTEINISVGDVDPDSYAVAYRTNAGLLVFEGIVELLQANQQAGHPLLVNIQFRSPRPPATVLRDPLFNQNILPHVGPHCRIWFCRRYDNWSGMISADDIAGDMRLIRPPRSYRIPCKMLYHPAVAWDGTLHACGCRELPLTTGNTIGRYRVGMLSSHDLTLRAIIDDFKHGRRMDICDGCTNYWPV